MKDKFRDLRGRKVPTGDPHLPPHVRRAREIQQQIEATYEMIDTTETKTEFERTSSVTSQPRYEDVESDIDDGTPAPLSSQLFTMTLDEKQRISTENSPAPSPTSSSSSSSSTPKSTQRRSPMYTAAHKRKRALEDAVVTLAEASKRQITSSLSNSDALLAQLHLQQQQLQQQQQQFQLQMMQCFMEQQHKNMMEQQQQTQIFMTNIIDKLALTLRSSTQHPQSPNETSSPSVSSSSSAAQAARSSVS